MGTLDRVKPAGQGWTTQPETPGGGGDWGEASTAKFSGSGTPVGNVTPTGVGDLYVDDTTPALWQSTGLTNTDWQQVGTGGSQPYETLVVSLTPEEITDLADSPVEILADPGEGKYIRVLHTHVYFKFGTVPYIDGGYYLGVVSDGNLAFFQAGSGGNSWWSNPGNGTWDQSNDTVNGYTPFLSGVQAIQLLGALKVALSGDESPTGGDGSLTFTIFYLIADVPT